MLNQVLASRLNRADLQGYNPPLVPDPYSNPQIAAGALSPVASLSTGRISAGLVGVLVLLAGGFYLWTRRHQS
jgi:hypothetical protein